MKTGQVMQQFGIKRDTLRFYTEQGLLQPQLVNGNYHWNEEEINNLENILGLRQLGLSVKAIIRIKDLHDTKCGSLEQLKENKDTLTRNDIETIQQTALKEIWTEWEDYLND